MAGAQPASGNLALGLALASVLVMIVLGALDADGPIWLVQGVLALAAVATGLQARRGGKLTDDPLLR